MNNSGILSPHSLQIDTLSPVQSGRSNRNSFFKERIGTSDRYGGGSRNGSEIDRKPSTTSNYRIRKIGPKSFAGGE